MSVNKVILVGHIGKDPEVRYMPSGEAIANASLATTEKWKGKDGEKQEKTEWHRISFFGKLAEIVSEYVKKGSLIYIEGRLQTRKWQDKEGNDKYTTEIVADRMQMLGAKDSKPAEPPQENPIAEALKREAREDKQSTAKPAAKGDFDDFEDDIPW